MIKRFILAVFAVLTVLVMPISCSAYDDTYPDGGQILNDLGGNSLKEGLPDDAADFMDEHELSPENIGEDYNEIYTENPLEGMDNYEIYMNDVSKQESLVTWLESIPQVDRVRHSEVAATTLTGVNALVAYTSVGIIAILLAVSVFLINNTVMIGISVRKSEIEIMKYIGAPSISTSAVNRFILRTNVPATVFS